MNKYIFTVYEVGRGAECLSCHVNYETKASSLEEAKRNVTNKIGSSDDYLDDPDYVKVKVI